MVEIAKALSLNADIIMMDEPSAVVYGEPQAIPIDEHHPLCLHKSSRFEMREIDLKRSVDRRKKGLDGRKGGQEPIQA